MSDTVDEEDVFNADKIEDLVENIQRDHSNQQSSGDGGQARDKYTCKCCGARVDSGKHKCTGCIEAGCEYGESKCGFN